jgi:hypothetical protein
MNYPITDETINLDCEKDPLITSSGQKKNHFRRHSVYNDCPTCKGSGKISKGYFFNCFYFSKKHKILFF